MYPRVSYSALARFEACSTRHRLHVARKRTPIPPEYVLVGNAMHYGMALFIDSHGSISMVQAAMWEFERRLREDRPRWDREKVAEQVARVRDGAAITEDLLQGWEWTSMRSEVHLLRCFRGWAIDGYLDLMITDGSQVWDLKTGSWHADQLVFYDLLVSSVLGRQPETVGVIEPYARGLVSVDVSEEERASMKGRIRSFVQRVSAEDWQFEGYSNECGRCSTKPFCPKWAAARSGSFGA